MLRTAMFWVALALPAAAQTTAEPDDVFDDWAILRTQNPAEPCLLQQIVQSSETRQTLIEGLLSPATDPADPPVLSFVVPNGVSLAAGIGYRHPEAESIQRLEWLFCTGESCLASRQLSPEEWLAMRRGTRILAGYRPAPQAETRVIPLSLMGVTRGWNAVAACAR